MARPLPISQLVAFEAAARHLSFTHSAGELNVQQPAVSRKVAALEDELGVKLFVRTKPKLVLTPEGEALYAAVSAGFDTIRRAVDSTRSGRRKRALVVNAAIGFTSYFLMPRLADFHTRYPDVELELVTRDQNTGFDVNQCDLVVVFGEDGLPGTASMEVFREELFAVCAPGYLEPGQTLSIEELAGSQLLHMASDDHADDWFRFFEGSGSTPDQPRRTDRIFSFMVYQQAVQNGNGIGLGWTHITDSAIAAEQVSLACTEKVRTTRGYHCCILERANDREEAMDFLNWISTLVE